MKNKFAEATGLGQVDPFMKHVLDDSSLDEEDDLIIPDLLQLFATYQNSDSISQVLLISLLSHDKYSKTYLVQVFGCSKYKSEQVRKWKIQNEGLHLAKKVLLQNRLNFTKYRHFLGFIFNSELLQDVAYGIKEI